MIPAKCLLPAGLLALLVSTAVTAQNPAVVGLSANSGSTSGQPDRWGRPAPDSRGWTDPALNHNRLLVQDGVYQQVGTYKVKGSQYLFGQKHKGDVFSPVEKAWNIFISYNTYNQELEFYSTSNPDKPLVKEPGTLDSFIIHADIPAGIPANLKFVYGSVLGAKEKFYYQEIFAASRFSVYKRYKSDLGYISSNYAEADLRQFDLEYEYYYTDAKTKGVKKIKANAAAVIKQFEDIKDLSVAMNNEAFTANQEDAMRRAFEYLNK
ncbi:MAG: hypothetical protein ABIR30_02450 [Chitinophagaceae bacterium]